MVFAALLRGINVGGNNKISMKELKQVIEEAGVTSVNTYINSGNSVFTDAHRSKAEVTAILEKAIPDHFGLNIKVLVYSIDKYSRIAEAIPAEWANDERLEGIKDKAPCLNVKAWCLFSLDIFVQPFIDIDNIIQLDPNQSA